MKPKPRYLRGFAIFLVYLNAVTMAVLVFTITHPKPGKIDQEVLAPPQLHPIGIANYQTTEVETYAARRQAAINRVQAFMRSYGSPLVEYAPIIVDQAQACGGNYRILVGIAGSESGLGRINYKLYNPYGYLNGVQYSGFEEALTVLSCRISQQFLSVCKDDLWCLVKRYAGPQDDPQLFVSKVAWFASQV